MDMLGFTNVTCLLPPQGPPVLLIHGYGASAYHWRYQIPALAQNYRVYALDLLGGHVARTILLLVTVRYAYWAWL